MVSPGIVTEPARIAEALSGARLRPAAAGRLRLEKAWPVREGLIAAQFSAAQKPSWSDRWTVVGWPNAEPSRRLAKAAAAGSVHVLPELGAFVMRFPVDPWLPQLASSRARAGRASGAGGPLAESAVLAALLAAGDGRLEVRPLSYKPMRRCALELRRGATPLLFAKCYRGSLAPLRRVQHELAAARARGTLGLLDAATPCGVVDECGLLLWRPAEGRALTELLAGSEAEPAAAAVGGAIADLHDSDVDWPRAYRPEDELGTLGRWVGITAGAFPDRAARLYEIREALGKRAAEHPVERLCPSHRDLHDGQVLVRGEGVIFLDFDTACRAEPELDVANLLAHLKLRALERPALRVEPLAHVLLAGYAARRPEPLCGARLGWYLASALLRLACVHAFRPTWTSLSGALLDEAARLVQRRRTVEEPRT